MREERCLSGGACPPHVASASTFRLTGRTDVRSGCPGSPASAVGLQVTDDRLVMGLPAVGRSGDKDGTAPSSGSVVRRPGSPGGALAPAHALSPCAPERRSSGRDGRVYPVVARVPGRRRFRGTVSMAASRGRLVRHRRLRRRRATGYPDSLRGPRRLVLWTPLGRHAVASSVVPVACSAGNVRDTLPRTSRTPVLSCASGRR